MKPKSRASARYSTAASTSALAASSGFTISNVSVVREAEAIADAIASLEPDLVTLQEVRQGAAGAIETRSHAGSCTRCRASRTGGQT